MDTKAGTAPDYVNSLVRATRNVAESHVMTDKDLGDNVISIHQRLRKIFKELNPDIIHIHASWTYKAALVEWEAKRNGIFVTLSVHGGLAPDVMDLDFWKSKLPRIIAYQFYTVRSCHSLVAVSKKEGEQLNRLGWKKRMTTIPHPTLFSQTEDETREPLMAIYRKIIDTNYLLRITQEEIEFVKKCVSMNIWKENKDFDITTSSIRFDEVKESISSDIHEIIDSGKPLSFKRIYIYAFDHGVSDMMMDGARELGITMPPRPDISTLPRFKQKARTDKDKRNYLKLCEIISSVIKGEKTDSVFTISGEISFSTVSEIFTRLRFSNYDEEKMKQLINKAHIKKFTARLLGHFQDLFYMETGYMPIIPKA